MESKIEKPVLENHVIKPKVTFTSNDIEYRLISTDDEVSMDSKIDILNTFLENNQGFGKSEEIKDELYARAKELWQQYAAVLRNTKFTFWMNKKQFDFLTTLLLQKLEYDVNTVFFAIELTNMLGSWSQNKNDSELKDYTADATEVTYLYHLISKHKIRGLTKEAYLFAEVLRKIGDISKVIAYYDTAAKNLQKEIHEWVAKFEPELEEDSKQVSEQKVDLLENL